VTLSKSILRDVAVAAGVSLRTASRVLNDDPKVAVDTRARVQNAMLELSYTPDSMARSLRAGTDTAVGMVVESVADPFFSAMVAAVERAAPNSGNSVLVASTHGDAARERDVVGQMLSRRISGMLLTPTAGDHAWLRTNTPLVLVDRAAPGLEADVVGIDDEAAAADAVNHLVAHGHRRIAYVSDHPLVPTSRARLAGYRRALAAHGLEPHPELVRADCPDPVAAAAATRDLLAGTVSPTALLSAATRCSLGVVPTLHARGRTDIALVCFGDFAMADLLQPGVTVVDHSAAAVGAAAATRLAERIAQPDLPISRIDVPVRLIPRGSGELRP
jgi:LacI family transcriptional regulator